MKLREFLQNHRYPVLLARDRHRRLGGAGNVVRNVVSMGGTVALFATVGSDAAGEWFRNTAPKLEWTLSG